MKKLTKSSNRMFLGVCAGLANYFGLDVSITRLLFALGTFATGTLLFWIYIILALIMPKEGYEHDKNKDGLQPININHTNDH